MTYSYGLNKTKFSNCQLSNDYIGGDLSAVLYNYWTCETQAINVKVIDFCGCDFAVCFDLPCADFLRGRYDIEFLYNNEIVYNEIGYIY